MPVLALAPLAIGAYQAISGGIRANKARKALAGQKTPTYAPDKSIMDYYGEAANRYNVSPYNSQLYQYNKAGASGALANGVGALQDRRMALAGVSGLTQNYQGNLAKGALAAENQKNGQFQQLGRATQMQSADNRYAYGQNQLLPYNANRSLFNAEAAGGNQELNAGISNMANGIMNYGRATYGDGTPKPPKVKGGYGNVAGNDSDLS